MAMDWLALLRIDDATGLYALFAASLLAATVLPGGSEAVLAAVLYARPGMWPEALAVATLGNTLGGMSTYLLGRLLPARELPARLGLVRRHGSAALLAAWVPLVGDALCAAAGWLRLNWIACAGWMALGKFARYGAIAWLMPGAGA